MTFARLALVLALVAPTAARAQTPYTGAPLTHDFSSYEGLGLAPGAASGPLDSNAWFMTSASGSCPLGGTCPIEPPAVVPTGPFYGGISTGGTSVPSLYAYDTGAPSGRALGAEVGVPLTLTAVYRNDTGAPLTALLVSYTFAERNDVGGQEGVRVSIDPDGPGVLAPIAIAGLSDQSADAPVLPASFVLRRLTQVVDLSTSAIDPGDRFDVIFSIIHFSGAGGRRDEVAIDDVTVAPAPVVGSCGDGTVQAGEQCDPGPLGSDCCSARCTFAASGTLCGGTPTSACDAQDSCDGFGRCLPSFAPSGTPCRSAMGSCDVAETCTGLSAVCPLDRLRSSSTVCRTLSGACDLQERCTGSSPFCPPDVDLPDGVSCSNGRVCDGGEFCLAGVCQSGTAPVCDDGDVCTADLCAEPFGCGASPIVGCCRSAADCDDGDVCTVDTCSGLGGTCGHSAITGCCTDDVDCEDGNACTSNACDLVTNSCVSDPVADCCGSDSDCDDGNACTTDRCDVATGGCGVTPIAGCCLSDGDCDDGDACTTDRCAGGSCARTPVSACDAGPPDPDAGSPGSDAGDLDAGGLDGGGLDGGDLDGGDLDAGSIDAGGIDAGDLDGGPAASDGGIRDGGSRDAAARDGAPGPDALVEADAGDAVGTSGCGCRAGAASSSLAPGLLVLVGLLLARRRGR
jgi:MYXO-CTERM domain-containing protein